MDAIAVTFQTLNAMSSASSITFFPSACYRWLSLTASTHRRYKLLSVRHCTKSGIDNESEIPVHLNLNVTNRESENKEKTQQTNPEKPEEVKYSSSFMKGLVLDLGQENSWDSAEIGSPVVKRFLSDEEERWYMWYHGRSSGTSGDCIGISVSNNGIHWERGSGSVQTSGDSGMVMEPSKDWWAFDTRSLRPCEVLIMSSNKLRTSTAVYWLYYTGFSSEKMEWTNGLGGLGQKVHGTFKSFPGLAMSQDGRHWARIEGEHHSGALFENGSEREWDSLFIGSPRVVFHGNGDLRMYYHSFDMKENKFCIGIARSRDGIKWMKLGKIMSGGVAGSFDENGVLSAHVVSKRNGGYLMAYEGVASDGMRSIGLAESLDGLMDWIKVGDGPVLNDSNKKDRWDKMGVGTPCLVQMDEEEWRLYYQGVGDGGRTGIGMAVSESGIQKFRRWAGFHL